MSLFAVKSQHYDFPSFFAKPFRKSLWIMHINLVRLFGKRADCLNITPLTFVWEILASITKGLNSFLQSLQSSAFQNLS